mmetsp:Transcript_2437/g.3971  ORF Transcript_2437/g.3971 Transcript_2437/m.3971 type:complete len:170 (-) Transcript_2437:60-569(-)
MSEKNADGTTTTAPPAPAPRRGKFLSGPPSAPPSAASASTTTTSPSKSQTRGKFLNSPASINTSPTTTTTTTANTTEEDIVIPMLSGAFAATTAWGVGYPFDLIKTQIQAGKSTGIINTARVIMRESSDGRACYGLYRGFGLKLLRSIPASAIGFLVYETAAKVLSSRS